MASVGLVSYDTFDSFLPASWCWLVVFSFIRDAGMDSKSLLWGFILYDGEGSLTFYFLVDL